MPLSFDIELLNAVEDAALNIPQDVEVLQVIVWIEPVFGKTSLKIEF